MQRSTTEYDLQFIYENLFASLDYFSSNESSSFQFETCLKYLDEYITIGKASGYHVFP